MTIRGFAYSNSPEMTSGITGTGSMKVKAVGITVGMIVWLLVVVNLIGDGPLDKVSADPPGAEIGDALLMAPPFLERSLPTGVSIDFGPADPILVKGNATYAARTDHSGRGDIGSSASTSAPWPLGNDEASPAQPPGPGDAGNGPQSSGSLGSGGDPASTASGPADGVGGGADRVGGVVNETTDAVGDTVNGVAQGAGTAVGDAGTSVGDAVGSAGGNGVADGVGEVADGAAAVGEDAADGVAGAVGGLTGGGGGGS